MMAPHVSTVIENIGTFLLMFAPMDSTLIENDRAPKKSFQRFNTIDLFDELGTSSSTISLIAMQIT
jgi:hypothetical protein